MDQYEVKQKILEEHKEAWELLDEANPNYRRRFKRLCKALDKLIIEVKSDFEDAGYYADDSYSLCLMLGDTHDENEQGNQDLIAQSSVVSTMTGGDF